MYILLVIFLIFAEIIATCFILIGIISVSKTVKNTDTDINKIKKILREMLLDTRVSLRNINIKFKQIRINKKMKKILSILDFLTKFTIIKKFRF